MRCPLKLPSGDPLLCSRGTVGYVERNRLHGRYSSPIADTFRNPASNVSLHDNAAIRRLTGMITAIAMDHEA
jgi:hypothetical protein